MCYLIFYVTGHMINAIIILIRSINEVIKAKVSDVIIIEDPVTNIAFLCVILSNLLSLLLLIETLSNISVIQYLYVTFKVATL